MFRVTLVLLVFAAATAPVHALQAGAGKVAIDLPLGAPLWGHYDQPGRRAVAQHDTLWARALYLEDESVNALVVTADVFAITPTLYERVLEFAPEGISQERIALVATHTHNGPGGLAAPVAARWVAGPYREDILERVAQACGEAMQRAYDSRRRATVDYGATTQNTLVVNRVVDNGPVYQDLGVLRVDDSDGNSIAIAANFAAHPTTVGIDDSLTYSADYAGAYYDHLESLSNEGCVAMLLPGPLGDQACANPENQTGWAWTESIGRLLAVRTKGVANGLRGHELPLEHHNGEVTFPKGTADFLPESAPLQLLSIGNLALAFVPAEPYATVGAMLAAAVRRGDTRSVFVVALANGYHGLLPSRELLGAPGPEAIAQFYGPISGDTLARGMAALVGSDSEPPTTAEPAEVPIAGGTVLVLSGAAEERGRQRGYHYGAGLSDYFRSTVTPLLRDGEAAPDKAPWSLAPRFMNLTPFLLPHEAAKTRPWLGQYTPTLVDEVMGIADAAGMPFDAAWLSVCAQQARTSTPSPRMFPVRTADGGMLLGVLAPWAHPDQPPVVHVQADGLDYLQVGAGWTPGVKAGLNEAGLVVWCEAPDNDDEPAAFAPPAGCTARDLLLGAGDAEEAAVVLESVAVGPVRIRVAGPDSLDAAASGDTVDDSFAGLPELADRAALETHLRQQAVNAPFVVGDAEVAVCAAVLDPATRTAYLSFATPGEALADFAPYPLGTRP